MTIVGLDDVDIRSLCLYSIDDLEELMRQNNVYACQTVNEFIKLNVKELQEFAVIHGFRKNRKLFKSISPSLALGVMTTIAFANVKGEL